MGAVQAELFFFFVICVDAGEWQKLSSKQCGQWALSLGEVCGGPGAVSKELQEDVCRLLHFKEGKWDISWSSTEVRAWT